MKQQRFLRKVVTEMGIEFLIANTLVVLLMVIASLVAVLLRDLLAAAIALAAMSLLLSLEFFLLQAPDVAIAQAGVGACLTTAIVIIAIKGTKRVEEE
jgi:energy-converting hydrogenase B subunit D